MTIDYDRLMSLRIPDTEHTYTARDTILYAMAIGMAADPLDKTELPFVLEPVERVVPTMATVIAWNDAWLYETGADMVRQVHGEQRITLHRPLPPAASVVASTQITDAFDKGAGRGAIILSETVIRDRATGAPLCTTHSTSFARADGGFGGPAGSGPAPHPIPERKPDAVCDLATRPDQALLYRLCGDRNPLHLDPAFATAAGFQRPIIQGLCTYAVACRAVLRTFCDNDPSRIGGFDTRFTSPVFPGETLRTEMWQDGDVVAYRTRVLERDVVALNNGKATLLR